MPPLYPAAVEKDVYAIPIFEDRRRQGRYRVLRCQIGRVDTRFAAELFDEAFGFRVRVVSLLQTN